MTKYRLEFVSYNGRGREIPYSIILECSYQGDANTVGGRISDALSSSFIRATPCEDEDPSR